MTQPVTERHLIEFTPTELLTVLSLFAFYVASCSGDLGTLILILDKLREDHVELGAVRDKLLAAGETAWQL